MRLRNIPRAAQVTEASPLVIKNASALQGVWRRMFEASEKAPLAVEIGMGKGRFLRQMAALHTDSCYVGIERYTSVLLRAVEGSGFSGAEGEPLPNYRFVCEDAAQVTGLFAPGEVDRIYLNFSDPWPKERHASRRLTSPRFLALYERILAADGTLEFKTDNVPLFDYSLKAAEESGWKILAFTRDLHGEEAGWENVMTEYEEKFSSLGNPICKMVLLRPGM